MKNLYFTGFIGTGKTYLGSKFSFFLKKKYFDTDRIFFRIYNFIVYKNLSKKNIFLFRKIEKNVLNFLSKKKRIVVSTGGGIILFKINILRINKIGINILLKNNKKYKVDLKKRPLISKHKIYSIYNRRKKLYKRYFLKILNKFNSYKTIEFITLKIL